MYGYRFMSGFVQKTSIFVHLMGKTLILDNFRRDMSSVRTHAIVLFYKDRKRNLTQKASSHAISDVF